MRYFPYILVRIDLKTKKSLEEECISLWRKNNLYLVLFTNIVIETKCVKMRFRTSFISRLLNPLHLIFLESFFIKRFFIFQYYNSADYYDERLKIIVKRMRRTIWTLGNVLYVYIDFILKNQSYRFVGSPIIFS